MSKSISNKKLAGALIGLIGGGFLVNELTKSASDRSANILDSAKQALDTTDARGLAKIIEGSPSLQEYLKKVIGNYQITLPKDGKDGLDGDVSVIITKQFQTVPIVQELNVNGLIIVNSNASFASSVYSYSNIIKIGADVTDFIVHVSKEVENWDSSAGTTLKIPLIKDYTNQELLLESGGYYSEDFSYINDQVLQISGRSIHFIKTDAGWAYGFDPYHLTVQNFWKTAENNLFQGANNQTITIRVNDVIKDKIYTIINAKDASATVTVTFGTNPQNYSSAVFTIKNKAGSVAIQPLPTEYQGSMRFMFSSAVNKFVIL